MILSIFICQYFFKNKTHHYLSRFYWNMWYILISLPKNHDENQKKKLESVFINLLLDQTKNEIDIKNFD